MTTRVRPRVDATLDSETVTKLNRIIQQRKAKNVGYAIDMAVNHYFLTSSAEMQTSEERRETMAREALEKGKAVMNEALKEAMEGLEERLTRAMKEVIHIEIDHAMKLDAIEHPQALTDVMTSNIEPELTFEQLLDKCPGSTSNQITDWSVAWTKEIEATGRSIDEFVAAKVAKVQRMAKPVSAPKPMVQSVQATVEDVNQKRKADATQKLEFAMVDYWLTKNSDKATYPGILPTKEFHVALAANRIGMIVNDMDNGSGDEFLTQVDERLTKGATARGWDANAFMEEYDRIYRESVQIIERSKEAMKA